MVKDFSNQKSEVIYAAPRPIYHNCVSKTLPSWHILGAAPCKAPSPCCAHYGLCIPVLTEQHNNSEFGTLNLDVEFIEQTLRGPERVPKLEVLSKSPIVADLAAPKRLGHLSGGPDATSQRKQGSKNSSSNLFSLELMQTDDVSTIAEQIANQAELIYQAWKTTDLNPSELIQYHSVTPDRSSPFRSGSPFGNSPISSPVTSSAPRIPMRSISPAPPGSSPAIMRRVIEIPISTPDRPSVFQKSSSLPPETLNFHPHSAQRQQHVSSPARTLNASPRPYIPPSSAPSSRLSMSPTLMSQNPLNSRSFTSPSSSITPQPPLPPERSSSYVEGPSTSPLHQQKSYSKNSEVRGDPELEASLRELVTNFVMEDKARLATTNVLERPKSAPSSIQDALQRFERQMAITSRVAEEAAHNHDQIDISSPSIPVSQSIASPLSPKTQKLYGSKNESPEPWNRREGEGRARRSISPSPNLVSQPGWNELPHSSTSTWPLKNKQPSTPERRGQNFSTNQPSSGSTNYITTLETQLDNEGRSPGVPIRHKVITMSEINKEDGKPLNPLKNDTYDVVDSYRSLENSDSSQPGKNKPKFSISVTVDVENSPLSLDPSFSKDKGQSMWQPPSKVENLSTIDYAKIRYHDAQQHPKTTQRLEDYRNFSNKNTINGDGRVLEAKSRFEINPSSSEVPWRTVSSHSTNDAGMTLPDFYKRKLRRLRKMGSPEPFNTLAALPHPQLTDQQKAHIRERSLSPTAALGANIVVRPFLTQGSVAERVLLFEKAPTEVKKATPTSAVATVDEKRPTFSSWRDPDEVRTKAQETSKAIPRQHLEALPSISAAVHANVNQNKPSNLRDVQINKENATPMVAPIRAPASPVSPPVSSSPTRVSGSRRNAKTSKNILIPRFYYPLGRPSTQVTQEQQMEEVAKCFRDHEGRIHEDNMEPLMRACQIPLYWKAPLFIAAGGEKVGFLSQEQFVDYWRRVISTCHDISSRFVKILSRGTRNYLLPEDFLALIQDVVDTHPGLTFLKEATEFHSRYVHTVIARIYYCVNRSWSGRITVPEIRRSNLLQVISYLEEEEDINKITDYFSYEHFYVIYCKFWELDTDHDLFIDKLDLSKHNERALSDKIIDRIFSGAVTRGRAQKQDRMGYQEFVWFLISEEDKRHPTAIEYWFRCMDIDGDGYLSMYELEYFYEDQLQRMEALGIETLPFIDCLCQMLDMVRPAEGDKISLSDLKKCRMTPVFFDTFFNFDKYLDHEQRDPFASHRMEDEAPEISDWDRYAAEEYELLVAEEGAGDPQDDMLYDDELSMGVESVLDDCGNLCGLSKPLSTTVPNLSIDHMEVDDDYSDYADSDDYQY